jgi:hypothetical protein
MFLNGQFSFVKAYGTHFKLKYPHTCPQRRFGIHDHFTCKTKKGPVSKMLLIQTMDYTQENTAMTELRTTLRTNVQY